MIAYKEIAQIKNVKGLNPITGDYSYEENGRGYLYKGGKTKCYITTELKTHCKSLCVRAFGRFAR